MLGATGMGQFPHYLVVVRAGDTQLFEDLKAQLAAEPYPAALIWDRRRPAGRDPVPMDRPAAERRAPPDPMLDEDGFLVTVTLEPPLDAIRNGLASITAGGTPAPAPRERIFALRMVARNLLSKIAERRARRADPGTEPGSKGPRS